MSIKFGPAGTAESFKTLGYKKTLQLGEYLNRFDLTHFEYQCGRGVHIGTESAIEFGNMMKQHGITVSLHAPYFISLSSLEEEKRNNSIGYILDSAKAVAAMGGDRIVIHSGSCGKQSREAALELAKESMKAARLALVENGLEQVRCCLETMGKVNQLGTLQEVMELCKIDDSFLPCIDFGHLNARNFGEIKGRAEYEQILDTIKNELGEERYNIFHAHFSKIEYTVPGGEKRHLTFEDNKYGPDFEPLIEVLAQRGVSPVIVCESAGTQTEDSKTMQDYYLSVCK